MWFETHQLTLSGSAVAKSLRRVRIALRWWTVGIIWMMSRWCLAVMKWMIGTVTSRSRPLENGTGCGIIPAFVDIFQWKEERKKTRVINWNLSTRSKRSVTVETRTDYISRWEILPDWRRRTWMACVKSVHGRIVRRLSHCAAAIVGHSGGWIFAWRKRSICRSARWTPWARRRWGSFVADFHLRRTARIVTDTQFGGDRCSMSLIERK